VSKLLRVTVPHFVAGCEWHKTDIGWEVDPRRCAPILRWMIGKTPCNVAGYFRSKGWTWEWIN
jgi:hypothetical protein